MGDSPFANGFIKVVRLEGYEVTGLFLKAQDQAETTFKPKKLLNKECAGNNSEESNTLNESSCKNHVCHNLT